MAHQTTSFASGRWHHAVFPVAFALLLSTGCAHLGKGTGPYGKADAFSGRVTDQQGRPVVDARIEVAGAETRSRSDGSFRLRVPRASRYLLDITHPDFADLSHLSREPLAGQTWKLVRAQVETVDPTGPIVLVDARPELAAKGLGGARFELAPDSLVDDQGRPPAGMVRATIATLDVGAGEGPGEWAVRSDDGRREGYLVSYGAVFVQLTDPAGGVTYQLRPGRTADLSLPVVPSMRSHTPPGGQAPFWYYDAADGTWKRNGTSVFDPVAESYVGQVDHLSTINTDIAKFDDAACLKLTLDPAIGLGNSLRIRYHSGGTAFGQAPTFVMNDTENAAYRLPANTNVLLELIDGGDVVGNLVVEDPAGSPLVNTVVNTGPPIPAGNSLWPPPPFVDCKPIVLSLGAPEVEIRVNELPAAPALRDDPTDDYLTWAPTFALVRLATPMGSDVTVVLTNDPPGAIAGGGDVVFAQHQDPWPADTTATAATLTLTLPADGSWVPFVVAGEHGSPSTNDKDAIVEAHQGTAAGPTIGTKALMVRIRKDANTLTPSERDRFLFAWRNFRNQVGTNYVLFQEMHRLASGAGDEAHGQPAFLSWHRAMLLQVERELQAIDPSVALHYWDWDAAAPNLFSADFMGAPGNDPMNWIAEPEFSITNPLNGWNTDLPFEGGDLMRSESDHTADPGGAMKPLDEPGSNLLDFDDYGPTSDWQSFSADVEGESHNQAHGWPCASGHLTAPNRSAADPLFYLLHSQIDRQWAYWQRQYDRFGTEMGGALTFPAPAHYDNNGAFDTPGNTPDPFFRQKGSYLEDGLWPWDGTTGGTAGTVEWRPPNQATAMEPEPTVVPDSMPMIPMTSFPASPHDNLWPPVATVPTNADMIDYLGRFQPQDGLGFSYDDVPY